MSVVPTQEPTGADDNDNDNAMKAALQSDAAAWSAARNETTAVAVAEFSVPVTKRPTPARKPRTAVAAAKPVVVVKKPFSMAYDGVSTAEHIQYMIDHGAR